MELTDFEFEWSNCGKECVMRLSDEDICHAKEIYDKDGYVAGHIITYLQGEIKALQVDMVSDAELETQMFNFANEQHAAQSAA